MSRVSAFFDRLSVLLGPVFRPIDARLNPILVKEVRQALRGRYFTVVFWLMVTIATTIGCLMLVAQGRRPDAAGGIWFFVSMYGCLSVSVHLFVPFSAFLSVGSEWDENTYDLLVLSDLRPSQIVLGKLLSAGVQVLLFYSAFGPFVVFAFLLRGLDLTGAAWILGGTLITSFALTSLAVCLSSLVRHKFARVMLMAVLAAILIGASVVSIVSATQLLMMRIFHAPEFRDVALAFFTGALTVAVFSLAYAATRFTHPEENRSTSLRVLTTTVVLIACGWGTYLYHVHRDPEIVGGLGVATLACLTLLSTTFVAEEEKLGRRVRMQVPKNPVLALLAAPFLPGGGRGVLHYLLNGVLVLLCVGFSFVYIPNTRSFALEGLPAATLLYFVTYLLLPTALLSRWSRDLRYRILARFLVPCLALLAFVVPTVVGFLLSDDAMLRMHHVGNPAWTVFEALDDDRPGLLVPVAVMALVTLLLNVPRVLVSLRELSKCSSERRRRELPRRVELEPDAVPEA